MFLFNNIIKSFLAPRFIAAVLILGLAAGNLRQTALELSRYYQKQPLKPLRSLAEFNIKSLPGFTKNWTAMNRILPDDIETDQYIAVQFDRENKIGGKTSVVLFVTYYSDPKSKVPHTPDVCYRQAGAILEKMTTTAIDTVIPGIGKKTIQVNVLLFKRKEDNIAVLYVLCADGEFSTSRESVRWITAKPGNLYTYFSKIEAASNYPLNSDPAENITICKTLLSEAIPVLVADFFPSKEQLKRR